VVVLVLVVVLLQLFVQQLLVLPAEAKSWSIVPVRTIGIGGDSQWRKTKQMPTSVAKTPSQHRSAGFCRKSNDTLFVVVGVCLVLSRRPSNQPEANAVPK
jgi:hypothetical protein